MSLAEIASLDLPSPKTPP